MKKLAVYLREERAKRELSQKELAIRSGLDRTTIIRLEDENSNFEPKLDTLWKLSKTLGVSLNELKKRV